MSQVGKDIPTHRSKSGDEFVGQPFDYVISVCDNAKELEAFREVWDEIAL